MKNKILLVDDEIEITEINKRYLEQAGYDVVTAHDGIEALTIFKKMKIDLIITDIMMPNMDGYDFISEIQYINSEQAFLFITAKTAEPDKIYALSMGADDFITKPFSPRELVLRVRNILRRIKKVGVASESITLGDLQINHASRLVIVGEKELDLTVKSFELLWLLASNPERVFSKTELYERIWQEDYVDDTNTLNVHIHALRQDLSKYSTEKTPTIKTVWGLGYKIEKAV
ncbi:MULTISPECIES: response regulator transcription factor [Gemella]|uniref:response regulator transcription factor n=1 Tax=Gemella TaxID=1378 RepID=UPI000767E778|nr:MULTISPECIES: response regulator transcription factor [Gemella]AME10058.1 two-component system response regulator [Gemella sp. oral taxon 928]AXI26194.1 DNA-binding response regulator [Gemella sp. ND 6198]